MRSQWKRIRYRLEWAGLCLAKKLIFFFSSRRRHTIFDCDWSSDVCSSDLLLPFDRLQAASLLSSFYWPIVQSVTVLAEPRPARAGAPAKPKSPNKKCRAEDRRCRCSIKPEVDILRFFSARGDLCALLPRLAELADQIEGAGDENGVLWRGFRESVFERALGIGDHGKTRGMMAGDFRELRGGNGARGARRGEDDFRGVGEEEAGDFVDSFVAKSGID